MRPFFVFSLFLTLAVSSTTALGKPYVDTKKRFAIEPAGGWELAPLPGDVLGMNFRKKIDGVPASMHVMVQPTRPGATLKQTLDEAEAPFRAEIGYNPGTDVPVVVGGVDGTRRSLSVFASGDRTTVRAIELYAIHAFGHAHVLHVETLEKKRPAITRDIDRMLASYKATAGRDVAAPLAGLWVNTGGGPDLKLEPAGAFRMGALNGGWRSDGGVLELRIAAGAEKYRYLLNGDTLTLSSPNLGGDLVFRRSGTALGDDDGPKKPKRTGPVTREELIGTWRVLGQAATEPLKLILASSGSVQFGGLSGRWRFSTGRLTITSTAGQTITYAASMTDEQLVLSGGDLDKDVTLERDR
jgi:hypothetical protein